jgi:hypothetical protein
LSLALLLTAVVYGAAACSTPSKPPGSIPRDWGELDKK